MPTIYNPPVPTYVALQTITLTGAAASVTFGSIPNTYRDLVIIANLDNSSNTELFIRLNGDTGSNYYTIRIQGNGTTDSYNSTSNATGARLVGNGDIMTDFTFSSVIQILDYSISGRMTGILSRTNSSNGLDACSVRWQVLNPVTSVTLYPAAGSLQADSTLSLYGIEA